MPQEPVGPVLGRRQVLRTGAFTAAALFAGPPVLAACSSADPNTDNSGGTPVNGGTLTVGMMSAGQSESLNPGLAYTFVDIFRSQQIWEGLYQLGPDANPQPWLAESATPNSDTTEWTVKLKSGVTWHDGKPLTADDVIYTIKSWANDYSSLAGIAVPAIDVSRLKKVDDLTLRVPLNFPYADFPLLTASYYAYIVPAGSQEFKSIANPVGTGPFKYSSFAPGSSSEFVANESYWGGRPYLDKVIVNSTFTDENARTNALLSGQVDVVPQMSYALAKTPSGQGVRVASAHTPQPYYITCRVDQEPFNDPRVMQALKLVVDQREIITSVFNGYAQPTPHLPLKGLKHFDTSVPDATVNIEKAKALLAAAGKSDLAIELNTSSAVAGLVEIATVFAAQAKKAGITVKVKQIDPTVYYNTADSGGQWLEYGMMVETSGGGASIPSLAYYYLTNLASQGWPNETHFGDASTDAQIRDAAGTLDEAEAREKWKAVQQVQLEQGGLLLVAMPDAVDGFRTTVHGCDPTRAGTLNNNDLRKAWKTA